MVSQPDRNLRHKYTDSDDSPESTDSSADRDAELEALRRAHEVLSRRLVAERAAFADGIARVQATLFASRSWRYTAPFRATIRLFGRLKP